nr:putative capsid [Marmot picobirnavirus]
MANNYKKKSNNKTSNRRSRSNANNRSNRSDRGEDQVENSKIGVSNQRPNILSGKQVNNDPQWYNHIYNNTINVGNLPFNIPVGTKFNILREDAQYTSSETATQIPGIMTISLIPTIGPAQTAVDPVNIAAQQIYTLTRKANSGAINYDKTDLMMTILAMDSAYMLYEILLRAYRTIGSYNYMNRYLPDTLMNAQGFSVDLYQSMADFRALLDLFAYRLASINIPDQFDFISRHSWLFSNIYKDAPTDKGQLYAFIPEGVYMWSEGNEGTKTHLEFVSFMTLFDTSAHGGLVRDLSQVAHAIDMIMNPILGSQDVATISGDIAKAFGENGVIKITPIEDYAYLEPVYDMEVITQMANLNMIDHYSGIGSIEQELSSTVNGPYLTQTIMANPTPQPFSPRQRNALLNFHKEDVTSDDIMVATRLVAFANESEMLTYGTELVNNIAIYYSPTETNKVYRYSIVQDYGFTNTNVNFARDITMWSAFDNAPTLYLYDLSETSGAIDKFVGFVQDVDNYTILSVEEATNLNNVAVMSLFAAKDFN